MRLTMPECDMLLTKLRRARVSTSTVHWDLKGAVTNALTSVTTDNGARRDAMKPRRLRRTAAKADRSSC